MNCRWRIIGGILKIRDVRQTAKLPALSRCYSVKEMPKDLETSKVYPEVAIIKAKEHLKRRPFKKKKTPSVIPTEGFRVSAYATAEEYDLQGLAIEYESDAVNYTLGHLSKNVEDFEDVLHVVPVENSTVGSKDIFIFREGSVVFWNFPESEAKALLNQFKNFEKHSYSFELVMEENENLNYVLGSESSKTSLIKGRLTVNPNPDSVFDKFAVSNAMAYSVRLGVYESILNDYIDSMFPVTESLKLGRKVTIKENDVLKKIGQLFTLRHLINLSSDLLDTPDFYWEREELEKVYLCAFNYFSVGKRTKVMNEKINLCMELVELLSTRISERHHIRMELAIIALITIEVFFELLHYAERYTQPAEVA